MMGTRSGFENVAAFVAWLSLAPGGTRLDAQEVAGVLAEMGQESSPEAPENSGRAEGPLNAWTWRERLWTVPAETRLGVAEVAEALGKKRNWVYDRTRKTADYRMPHRKLDGALVFTAGEMRAWVRDREDAMVGGPMESTDEERRQR